jgi:type IV pilus assembly protein PilC
VPTFDYTARDKSGAVIKGSIVALDRTTAGARIIEKSLAPILIKTTEGSKKGFSLSSLKLQSKVKNTDKVIFTQQLATMVNAGVPLARSLGMLKDQTSSPTFKKVLTDLTKQVEGGSTLANAMSEHHQVFSDIFINMVAAGETGGILDEVLNRLGEQQEKDAAIVSKVRGAMIYPGVITVAALAAVIFLMTFIVPKLAIIFESLGSNLPWYTKIMLDASYGVTHFGIYIGVVLAILGFTALRYTKTPKGKLQWHSILLKLPIFGSIIQKVNLARFARTLGSLVASGIPILEALASTSSAISNVVFKNAINEIAAQVKNGKTISEPLRTSKVFPSIVAQMIAVGEETGQLDTILIKVAIFYENEVDTVVANMTSVIEPILIIVIGAVVGFIVVSVFGPISALSNAV